MEPRKRVLGWTDAFLIIIILLNVFDFFKTILPGELDYAKKIISWTLLGYLLFRASPTKVFFGERHDKLDTAIILSYFLLVCNLLITYAHISLLESRTMQSFFLFIIRNGLFIEQVTFVTGVLVLVAASVFIALRVPFHKRSIMGVLHEEGYPDKRLPERMLMALLVTFGFFVMVFNMMMQWLAIAVDATILLIALLFWSVFLVRHQLSTHRFFQRVGNVGNDFYGWFIDHFRYRETFFLGIVGLLVLHLATDVGIFLVPYLTGIEDPIYLNGITLQYGTLWEVFRLDWLHLTTLAERSAYALVFAGSFAGYLFLFISPAVIWRSLYQRKHPSLPRGLLLTFMTALPAVGLASLFTVRRLDKQFLAGVNVQLQSLQGAPLFLISGLMIVFLVLSWMLISHRAWRRRVDQVWVATSIIFFVMYIWRYFIDVMSSLQEVVMTSVKAGVYFFAVVFFVFQALLIMFYAGGLLVLLYELVHRTSHRKHA